MNLSKLINSKNEYSSKNLCEKLYKGSCVKIKNSQKTFQVIGINPKKQVCWLREWPFVLEAKKTFALEINQITLQTFCSNRFSEKPISKSIKQYE